MSSNFPNKRVDNVLGGIKFVEATNAIKQFYKLIVYFSLIFWFFLFFFNLSLQNFQKFRFKKHFLDSDEDLKNGLNDLTHSVFKSNTVGNCDFIVNVFVAIEQNQILQLVVYDLELFAYELLEQEDISVFVNVEQSVYVGSD